MKITVTKFKAHCLSLVEKVQKENCRIIISRHGQAAAELVPISETLNESLFGRSAGQAEIKGDILSADETWDAES